MVAAVQKELFTRSGHGGGGYLERLTGTGRGGGVFAIF